VGVVEGRRGAVKPVPERESDPARGSVDLSALLAVYYSLPREGVVMSFGGDEGSEIGFTTARGRDWPSVRQFNVFVENRLGNLLNIIRRFETSDNRIVS